VLGVGGKKVEKKEGSRHSPISLGLDYSVGLRFPESDAVNRCRILGQKGIVGRGRERK